MYDKRAKQDALDLWFSMPGEMSVDDFAAELGYPSGSTLRNWIKADPRHDPDKCQYRSKPVLPKLEAIRRVAEGATAAQAARETGLTPQQVRYSVGRYARGGTAALLPAPARKRRKGEAVDEGKTRRASRPARPMPCEQPPGLPEELPDDPAALKAIIADLELSNAALREVLAVLKAGAPALTNAEAAGCASRLEGAFGAAAACAALGLARSTYYYQLDALTSPSAPPDGTAGEVERAFRVDGNSSRGYRFVREVVSRRRGRPVSEKVVRRLMRGLGLRVCYARRGRYSSYAGEIDAPAPNLLLRADGTHDFSAGRPNEAWVSDVTEFRLPDDGRKVYLSPVVDLFDGKPVGWAVGTSPDARLTESSLRDGVRDARGGGGARRAHRPRLPLPLARVEGHMRAPRAGQVDVAQGHQPRQRRLRGVLRQPEERVLPRAGLVGMDGGGLHGAAGRVDGRLLDRPSKGLPGGRQDRLRYDRQPQEAVGAGGVGRCPSNCPHPRDAYNSRSRAFSGSSSLPSSKPPDIDTGSRHPILQRQSRGSDTSSRKGRPSVLPYDCRAWTA
ncbi:MAG: IS3 family transposase [Adlercreutzia sp.]